MNYEIKLIKKEQHKTSQWSGGTTTQLYIYPENSQYDKRDFLFRISSAKVQIEESTFTNLPGINREIMILDGELDLYHEGHHQVKLKKYDKDSFSGDWCTKSYGKVTDFNLMMNTGCSGKLEHLKLEKDNSKSIYLENLCKSEKQTYIIYCATGNVTIKLEESIELTQEDVLILIVNKDKNIKNNLENNLNKINIENKLEEANIVISTVYIG
ncbi:HutD/Ves family protein [Romboutsia sp.]|uniref:HutD/Ves family protein n=1 Tax=Romboutsia sp. TaxID=1965302 RepID=UPI003F2F6F5A